MTGKKVIKRQRREYENSKNRGWYCMHRGWQDHPIFGNDPFTKREAWEWVIAESTYAHEGRLKEIEGTERLLMRGQLSHSLRFMARAWGWHKSKVERFLDKLQKNGMIRTETEAGQHIITVCNYNKYQMDNDKIETETKTQEGQKRSKAETNDKKVKKDNNNLSGGSASRAGTHAPPPTYELPTNPFQRELLKLMGPDIYSSWGKQLTLDKDGFVYTNSRFAKDRLNRDYADLIERALSNLGYEFKDIHVLDGHTPKKTTCY